MDEQTDFSDDEKSPCEYREDLFNALCGDAKPLLSAATMLPPKAQCPVCSKWFRDKTRVHEHLNVHYGARPLNCNVCGTNFAARSNLIKHSQQHHAPFACHVCGCGPFADVRMLSEHTRNEHPELHRFGCHLCDASFARQADLSEHLISHPPALLEVRRRKRAPDSPTDLSDADDVGVKRPRAAIPLEPQLGEPADLHVPKVDQDAYSAAAFFGLDATALKHASVEELASHISKLSNMAVNLQHNGVLNALAGSGSFLPLAFAENVPHYASVRLDNGPKGEPLAEAAAQAQAQAQAHNCKLPSILLRKQTSCASPYPAHERLPNQGETPSLHDEPKKDGKSASEVRVTRERDRDCEIGVQCTLLDEQSAAMSHTSVPPCQRDMFVFQQLLAKLISRGEVFRCQHCEVIFFERGIYCLHRSLHDEHNPFQCAICGKRCANKDNFTLHFVNQKHQTGGCSGACAGAGAPLSPDVAPACTNGH